MEITVLLFGIVTDLVGENELKLPIKNPISVSNFKEELIRKYPQLKNLHTYAMAINEVYASDKDLIYPTDTVAIIPPVSGG